MPYRSEHLQHAIKNGHLEIVKLLVTAGVSTAEAFSHFLSAPREYPGVLKFLIESKARPDSSSVIRAISNGWIESARLLLAYDTSGEHLRLAAEYLGMSSGSVEGVKTLMALAAPQHQRDILEYGMQGALRRGLLAELASFLDLGARGDRLFWGRRSLSSEQSDHLRRLSIERGLLLPVYQRFPLARLGDDAWDYQLREQIGTVLEISTDGVSDSQRSSAYATDMRRAAEALERLLSRHIISAPLLEHFGFRLVSGIVGACKVDDEKTFRGLVEGHPDVLEPRFYLMEQVAASGSLSIVKELVQNFNANVNQHDGMPLAMVSHQGYVNVLEYLLAHGANVCANQNAALCEASRLANAEVIRALLKWGADPRVHRSRAVYDCVRQMSAEKYTSALRAAKFLVDAGASPRLFFPSQPIEEGPAMQYARFMTEALSPHSTLYLKTLEPRLNDSHINLSHDSYTSTPVFRFASSCAAVAARLHATIESPKLFVSLFKKGMSKVLDDRIGTFRELAGATDANIDLFQNVHDVATGALWDVIIPAMLAHPEELPPKYEDLILDRLDSLAHVVGQELFAHRSITEILKFSQIWHRADKQLPLDATPLRINASWYPLLSRHGLGNGFSIEALSSQAELGLEGANMLHCLGSGSYGAACLRGITHILSVRKDGVSRATVEVGFVPNHMGRFHLDSGRSLAVLQLRGIGNSQVDADVESAFENFMSQVDRGVICLMDGKWGETDTSRTARQRSGISHLETMTGIRKGEYPVSALSHYRDKLSVPAAQNGLNGRVRKIGLLDHELTESVISACRSILEGPPDKEPPEPPETSLSDVPLSRRPSRARVLAWEFQAACRESILMPMQRSGYSPSLSKLSFPKLTETESTNIQRQPRKHFFLE
jgi:hypothetical protein